MEKVQRDGKIAVLYSPGYGAGWSTWNSSCANREQLAMDASIVNAYLEGGAEEAIKAALKLFPDMYTGGGDKLQVQWVPKGTTFEITEYDGYETIEYLSDKVYFVA